jgi:hypothetical protein
VISVTNYQGVNATTLDLDPGKAYTHKLDFPADGNSAPINGVQLSPVGAGAGTDPLTGKPYSLTMNNPSDWGAGSASVMHDFIHNGGQPAGATETLTLSGLKPGTVYETRLYYRNFGTRPNTVDIDTDGVAGAEYSNTLDQVTSSGGNYWSVIYQADSSTATLQFTQQQGNNSWHQYAVTNEHWRRPYVFFSDNFNTGSNNTIDSFNPPSDTRQAVVNGLGGSQIGKVNWRSKRTFQDITGDQVAMNDNNTGQLHLRHNFVDPELTAGGGFRIAYDFVPNPGAGGDWMALNLGLSDAQANNDQNHHITRSYTDFGILFRGNGGYAVWDSGSNVASGGVVYGQTSHLEFEIVTGSFLSGAPARITAFYNGTVVDLNGALPGNHWAFTWTGLTENYIEFETNGPGFGFDNFVITTLPEPGTLTLLAFGGAGFVARRRRRRA